jgi:hypothetical protein
MFRDLTPTLAVRFNRLKVQQASLTSGPVGQVDRTLDIEARVQYFIRGPLAVTLGYILTLRDSSDPGVEFVENRVQLGLTYFHNFF